MANLLIEHEGVKGKGLKSIGKQGRAILTIDNNCSIYVDAFQGYGDTYQESLIPLTNFGKKLTNKIWICQRKFLPL